MFCRSQNEAKLKAWGFDIVVKQKSAVSPPKAPRRTTPNIRRETEDEGNVFRYPALDSLMLRIS